MKEEGQEAEPTVLSVCLGQQRWAEEQEAGFEHFLVMPARRCRLCAVMGATGLAGAAGEMWDSSLI